MAIPASSASARTRSAASARTRRCTRCLSDLSETEEFFRPAPRFRGGLTAWCRGCHKAYRSEHARRNRDSINAYVRERNRTRPDIEEVRADWRRRRREWREKNAEQVQAKARARYLISKLDGPRTLTVEEAARSLRLGADAVRSAIADGRLCARNYGGVTRVAVGQVRDYGVLLRREEARRRAERESLIRDVQAVGVHRAFCPLWERRQWCDECDRQLARANGARGRLGWGPRPEKRPLPVRPEVPEDEMIWPTIIR